MTSPNSRHTAETGPGIPSPILPPQADAPQQSPKPYVLVMLKGFCTEFFESEIEMTALAATLTSKSRPYVCYAFNEVAGHYIPHQFF